MAKPPAKAATSLGDEDRTRLMAAAVTARENNDSLEMMDADNRHWFVGTENVQNHAMILIQVRRGETIREAYLTTHDFTPDLVAQALTKLDGELQ